MRTMSSVLCPVWWSTAHMGCCTIVGGVLCRHTNMRTQTLTYRALLGSSQGLRSILEQRHLLRAAAFTESCWSRCDCTCIRAAQELTPVAQCVESSSTGLIVPNLCCKAKNSCSASMPQTLITAHADVDTKAVLSSSIVQQYCPMDSWHCP
jgi:hypothetical protein